MQKQVDQNLNSHFQSTVVLLYQLFCQALVTIVISNTNTLLVALYIFQAQPSYHADPPKQRAQKPNGFPNSTSMLNELITASKERQYVTELVYRQFHRLPQLSPLPTQDVNFRAQKHNSHSMDSIFELKTAFNTACITNTLPNN